MEQHVFRYICDSPILANNTLQPMYQSSSIVHVMAASGIVFQGWICLEVKSNI